MSDFIAIIRTGMITCYGRNPAQYKAVDRARREFIETAKYMGGLKEDLTIKVAVHELSASSGDVWWDERGCWDQHDGSSIPLLVVEEVPVTVKETKRRR